MPESKSETTTSPMTNGFDMFESFRAASTINQTMMDGVFECCHELNQFLASRFEKDANLQKALANTNSPMEAMEISASFARDAVQDYMEEMNRFATLAADTGRRNFKELNSEAQAMQGAAGAEAEAAAQSATSGQTGSREKQTSKAAAKND